MRAVIISPNRSVTPPYSSSNFSLVAYLKIPYYPMIKAVFRENKVAERKKK